MIEREHVLLIAEKMSESTANEKDEGDWLTGLNNTRALSWFSEGDSGIIGEGSREASMTSSSIGSKSPSCEKPERDGMRIGKIKLGRDDGKKKERLTRRRILVADEEMEKSLSTFLFILMRWPQKWSSASSLFHHIYCNSTSRLLQNFFLAPRQLFRSPSFPALIFFGQLPH